MIDIINGLWLKSLTIEQSTPFVELDMRCPQYKWNDFDNHNVVNVSYNGLKQLKCCLTISQEHIKP